MPSRPAPARAPARQRGRPVGTLGPVARALLQAAAQGPADVRTLAARACIGLAVARFTATRLVARGELVAINTGRPAVLRLAAANAGDDPASALALLQSWPRATAPGGSRPEPPSA